ncbi:MAG: ferrous iron transport protein A [Myxococcota bacterium]|nr:ferrous iron transport protein A [Myxococcota bacterium]
MKSNFNKEPGAARALADLAPGDRGVVAEVLAEGAAGRRLMDLGLLPETPVRALRRSPLGDPAVYEIRGYRLCLRDADARRVRLKAPDGAGPQGLSEGQA